MHVRDKGDIGQDAKHTGNSFKEYSHADHADAASAHFKEAYKADYGKKQPSEEGSRHLRAALAHNRLATTMKQTKKSLRAEDESMNHNLRISKAGPGSRGGKIIGSTKSGKPIYQHGGGTEGYHGVDHADAAEAHGAHGILARVKGDVGASNHHQAMAREHIAAASGPKPVASTARPLHQRIKEHLSGMGHPAMAHAKSLDGDNMTSTDLLKSYLAKSKVRSGNVDADSVDELDSDFTGASAKGKGSSAPGGFDDQIEADRKTKKKFKGHEQSDGKNGGRSVEAQTEVGSVSVQDKTLSNAGPYDCDGGEPGNISEPSPTKTVDGYVYRSGGEGEGEPLEKAEGARGGHVIGHTKSNKAIYAHSHAMYGSKSAMQKHTKGWSHQDHVDAKDAHDEASSKHGGNAAVASWEHEGLTGESGYRSGHHDRGAGADKAASMHRIAARNTNKSQTGPNFYKGGNGKMYQRQVHNFGAVQHVAGGMDQYCAELAKGGTFWANGSNWHNATDPGVAQMVMCKSCDHAHSVMYTACPECSTGGDFSKSLAQPTLNFTAPMRPAEPESSIVSLRDLLQD
jgi:hypothetical protein